MQWVDMDNLKYRKKSIFSILFFLLTRYNIKLHLPYSELNRKELESKTKEAVSTILLKKIVYPIQFDKFD